MRYWGIHRRRAVKDAGYSSSPTEHRATRPRGTQPRDRFGRFRKAGRDDDFALGGRPDSRRDSLPDSRGDAAADAPADSARGSGGGRRDGDRPRFTWSDFELADELPRAAAHPADGIRRAPDGRRHCGVLERVLHRQWYAADGAPTPEVVRAIESLADLPGALKEKLAAGLKGIFVGMGGVPDLDDMAHLRDRPLPGAQATWDICAGAYGDRKIIVGDRPSPTPDVMMHEVGHALDDIDGGEAADWRSDAPEFRVLYERCLPHLASDFHRQPDALGRREFFADAFAAIASRQRPALVDMLGGNIRTALDVMLFFNRRYGI